MILCPHCVTDIDEDGNEIKIQIPIRLASYPQPNTTGGGILLAWVCDRCDYDSTIERFASHPEWTYSAYRSQHTGHPKIIKNVFWGKNANLVKSITATFLMPYVFFVGFLWVLPRLDRDTELRAAILANLAGHIELDGPIGIVYF